MNSRKQLKLPRVHQEEKKGKCLMDQLKQLKVISNFFFFSHQFIPSHQSKKIVYESNKSGRSLGESKNLSISSLL
jgi:hypothetical protein